MLKKEVAKVKRELERQRTSAKADKKKVKKTRSLLQKDVKLHELEKKQTKMLESKLKRIKNAADEVEFFVKKAKEIQKKKR